MCTVSSSSPSSPFTENFSHKNAFPSRWYHRWYRLHRQRKTDHSKRITTGRLQKPTIFFLNRRLAPTNNRPTKTSRRSPLHAYPTSPSLNFYVNTTYKFLLVQLSAPWKLLIKHTRKWLIPENNFSSSWQLTANNYIYSTHLCFYLILLKTATA